MAKKPTIDVSTYSTPANLPGFLVEFMLLFFFLYRAYSRIDRTR
jgi:hypothetical protein